MCIRDSQYVEFLHQQEQNQLNIAGEYFVMAATLMSIKSAMLLPSPPVVEDELPPEEEDPRAELVAQLLEYQRYKKAAAALKDKEEYRQREYTLSLIHICPFEIPNSSLISSGEL